MLNLNTRAICPIILFLFYRRHHHCRRNLEVVSDVTYNQLSDSILVLFAVQCGVV
jgi:hypothetical protein